MKYDWNGRHKELSERLKRELKRTDLVIGETVTIGCRGFPEQGNPLRAILLHLWYRVR